jgi:hypothetical protein
MVINGHICPYMNIHGHIWVDMSINRLDRSPKWAIGLLSRVSFRANPFRNTCQPVPGTAWILEPGWNENTRIYTYILYICVHTRIIYIYIKREGKMHAHARTDIHMYIHAFKRVSGTRIRAHTRTYTHIHAHTHIHTHARAKSCVHTSTHTYIRTDPRAHTQLYKSPYACIYVYIHIYHIYKKYVYIYT